MKVLAENCLRTDITRTMNKVEAAQQQMEGAIANLLLGNWACAITLAGAAEDVLPKPTEENDLFCTAQKVGSQKHSVTPQKIVSMFNEKRNWLKHDQSDNHHFKATQDFSQEDAVIMVLRAYTRFLAIAKSNSEHVAVFEDWFRKHYSDYLNHSEPSYHGEVAP
ncbi:MAG: hypothetical protein WCE69_02505 [Aestuariivirga sp.]